MSDSKAKRREREAKGSDDLPYDFGDLEMTWLP